MSLQNLADTLFLQYKLLGSNRRDTALWNEGDRKLQTITVEAALPYADFVTTTLCEHGTQVEVRSLITESLGRSWSDVEFKYIHIYQGVWSMSSALGNLAHLVPVIENRFPDLQHLATQCRERIF